MRHKYAPTGGKRKGDGGHGRYVNPDCWITGPDPNRRDKYYAYLKHRSQARYRGEEHTLTWEDWENFWTDQTWPQRGRLGDSLVLGRLNWSQGWHINNCEIMTRRQHFAFKQGKKLDRS